jgi:predicted metalloendopeptidase
MINSVSFNAEFNDGDIHEIYIVPMTIPSRLGRLTKAPGYKKLMVNILKSFGGNASTVEADASRILEMEEKLVEIGLNSLLSRQDFLGNNGEFRQMTIRKLAESVPEVPWISYIEAALDHNPSVKIRPSTLVHIPDISKMKALGRMVEKLSVRDRANLLVWRMFVKFANDFLNTGSESDGLQENPWHGRDRKEVCLNQIDAFFPNAYDDLTIAENIDEKTTQGIKTVFQNLEKEFENIIDGQDWMSRPTKKNAKDKAKAMKINVGERTPNTTEYRQLTKKMATNNYIGNILEIGNYQFDSVVKKWEEPIPLIDYIDDETVVNAYYYPDNNEMTILTGILHGFFGIGLDIDIPPGLLYGGSMLLGHEMVHGFDDRGRVYDKDGLKFNWWKPSEVTEYNKRTQCLVEQYQNFSISYEGEDYSKSRAAAAGENIADNGGSKAAYEAYKKLPEAEKQCVPGFNFTSDQLYWLGYSFFWCTIDHEHENIGDYRRILERTPSLPGHFPAPWRVNTVFSNQPQFAEAFQCPQGSRLNPGQEERCAVW